MTTKESCNGIQNLVITLENQQLQVHLKIHLIFYGFRKKSIPLRTDLLREVFNNKMLDLKCRQYSN